MSGPEVSPLEVQAQPWSNGSHPPPPEPPGDYLAGEGHAPPAIVANDRDLAHVTSEALAALVGANDPPTIFRRGNALARVDLADDGHAYIETMARAAVRGQLARVAAWRKVTSGKDGQRVRSCSPPLDVVEDLMALPDWPVPRLSRVVTAPIFASDGSLALEPGYHGQARCWYQRPPEGLHVPEIPAAPAAADVAQARQLILGDLLGDFPFVSDAERAHALALILLPFVRELIDGPTPLHLVEAPGPGTGKGLLTEVSTGVFLGRPPAGEVEGRDSDEWRKRITTVLLTGKALVLFDNVRLPLDAGALASAITAARWEDRLLGHNRLVDVPVRCVWVVTGNNPVLSTEMARRTVRIRLDSGIERPWLRRGFRHPDLRRWARAKRPELVAAALTIGRAWLADGRPEGGHILGMFEAWARTMGGMLKVAGVEGFLGNLDEVYATADGEMAALTALVKAWWARHQSNEVGVAQLWALVDHDGIDLRLGDGSERSQKTRLGRLLGEQRGRVIDKLRVVAAGPYKGAAQWRLECVERAVR